MKKITLQLSIAVFLVLISSINLFSQVSFTTSPNNGCSPLVVTFTNTTTAPGAFKYEWSFGDGSPMLINYTPTTFTHTYNNPGNYNPMVNVYDNTNGYLGYSYGSGSIQVNGAGINSPDSVCVNDAINFCQSSGQANSYAWDFGDGGTSTMGGCVNHSYVTVGTYTVTLVTNTQSCGTQTVTRTVVVGTNVKPQAQAWTNINSTCPAKPMGFNTNTYASYSWNFGDPATLSDTSHLQNPSYTYPTLGTYTATVTVMNSCGKTASATTTVSVVNNPPWPNQSWFSLDANGSPACPNSNIGFNAPSNYSTYEWNFGDGSPLASSSNNYNNHTYVALGKYTVSVKIPSGCGNDTTLYDTVRITNNAHFPNQSWFAIKGNPVACPGSNMGFEAPNGYSTYVWNYGDGSPLYSTSNSQVNHQYSNTLATYTISVKITNGCGNDSTLYTTLQIKNNVGFPTQDFQLNGGPSPACPGDEVHFNAPNSYANYKWTFGDGDTATSSRNDVGHKYISAGTYTVTVKITNNCGKDTTISSSVVINNSGTFPNWLSIESASSACPDDLLDFRFSQSGYSSYHWDFGDGNLVSSNGERIQHAFTSTGTYTVSCQVTNGCGNSKTVSATVLINNSSPVSSNLTIGSTQNPSCPNDEIFLIINEGGQPNYKYYWNFGDGSAKDTTEGSGSSHIFTSVGTYTVTAIVTNGCGMTKAVTMTQVVNNTSVPTLVNNEGKRNWGFPGSSENAGSSNQNAGCKGDAIIFYFMGSSANNVWDFGDGNTETATESMLVYGGDGSFPVTIIKHAYAANGTYKIKLTVTNNCGNSVADSMMIVVGGGMVVNGDMTTSPPPFSTCAPIDFLAFGGSEYEYNFGDGNTISTVSPTVSHTFAAQGVYVISVVVTNGCGNTATYSRSINVNGVGGPAVTLTSSANPTCINDANGTAEVSVTSGQAPYMYSWDDANAQTSATATGLSAGLYEVTVTDAIGCASALDIQLNNPAPIVLNVSTTTTSCGGTSGTASVSAASGGTAPFIYSWSTGGTGASIGGLSTGSYSVTATDINGCTSLGNASISESGGATLSVATATNVSCNGTANGAIDINVSGGTPPYIFLWSNGATTEDITGLSAGNYSVLVSDAGACKATINKTITAPSVLATTTAAISPTCGNFDGTASATGSGGTGPYTYLWDPGAGSNVTTQSASGLPAGSYTVTVTDTKGCSIDATVSLSNSNAPNIASVITNVSCNGGTNGAIDITVTGGTSPYLYTWNVAPPNSQDKTGLAAGTYMVFVNDSKGCMSFRSYTITQPDVLAATVTASGATCSSTDGTATANVTGGNVPYTYLWTGGTATQTATGLSVGSYTVTVSDSKGCTAKATSSIAVAAPTPSICMVTVDDASVNNIIYWDKTQYHQVDSFIVYREVSTNLYKRIGAVKDTALSQFIDVNRSVGPANGDPNVGSYRYKLQLRDSCGNYSALSPYHNTIYILDIGSGQFSWSIPYTIEGGANPVVNYDLICDLANTDSWFSTGTVAGTQSSATDPSFAGRPNTARWRVRTIWSISCTPTRGAISTTRSNIKAAGIATSISGNTLGQLLIYPNPASEMVTIQYPSGYKKYQLQVFDALGQLVYNEQLTSDGSNGMITKQLNVSTFRKGMYLINLQTESGNTFSRIAIQ